MNDLTDVPTEALIAELDRRSPTNTACWFFGVWPGESAGHYIRDTDGRIEYGQPFSRAESELYPFRYWESREPQPEGHVTHAIKTFGERTVTLLRSWDRSADQRGGCAATFIIDAAVSPARAMEIARASFPRVFERIEAHLGRPTRLDP